ncbi:MAG: TolC family protein [Myxococcota bacterium]
MPLFLRLLPLLAILLPRVSVGAEVAVITDGPSELIDSDIGLLKAEFDALSGSKSLVFPDAATVVADYTAEGAEQALDTVLRDTRYSMVVAFGLQVGRAVAAKESLGKPVFIPLAAEKLMGLPRGEGGSGKKNLSYLTGLFDLERDLRRFRDVIRREATVFVIDSVLVPDSKVAQAELNRLSGSQAPPRLVSVETTPEEIVDAIPEGAEAVYLGPLPRLKRDDVPRLIGLLNERKLPTYASNGRSWVEMGAFVTLTAKDNRQRRMRQIALYMERAKQGENLGAFPTAFVQNTQLAINMKTARAIQFYPRFELLTEADLIDDDPEKRGPVLSLRSAVQDALDTNLDLNAVRREVEIADAAFRESWGEYLPVVSINGSGDWIDPDLASPFFNAEREFSYTPSVSQLIYSPRVVNNIIAQNLDRKTAAATVKTERLDTVSGAATAYLDVLRARTAERISRDNLKVTRANMALAELRVSVGTAGREELYRWQTEIANSRSDVIFASATRNQSEITLNRFRNRPLEESFSTVEPVEPEMGLVVLDEIQQFVEDPWSFKIFRNFLAEEANRNAPELTELENVIASAGAVLDGQVQDLFIPTVTANGSITDVPYRAGEGEDNAEGSMGIPGRVDTSWQVNIGLSLDLLSFPRYAEISETRQSIKQLEYQRDALAQRIEEGVRSALHQTSASRASVSLNQDAARAAEENLRLVQSKYREGTVDVITLIDAQNQALSARLSAANAVYDFLDDFVAVERAVGRYQFLNTKEERQAFVDRLRSFMLEKQDSQ